MSVLKQILISLLLLLCIPLLISAQGRADSLQMRLKSAKKSEKITVLHQLTQFFMAQDGEKAIEYANQAISLAEDLHKPNEKATAYKNIGNVYFYLGRYEEAENNYLKSIEISQGTGNLEGVAKSYNNIGVLNSRQGKYDKALEFYNKSLAIKQKLNEQKGLANTLNNIGEIYKFKGDYPNALINYQKSYDLKKRLKDKKGMANSLNNLGEIYTLWGDYKEALNYYLEATSLWTELENDQLIAVSYHNLGNLFYNLENYDLAIKNYQKALEIQTKIGNLNEMAFSLRNLGKALLVKKEYDKAQQSFTQALSIDYKLEDKTGIAITYGNLGELHLKKSKLESFNFRQNKIELDSAIVYFNKALELHRELGNLHGLAAGYNYLGLAFRNKGNYSKAISYYKKCIELTDTIKILNIEQEAFKGMAHAYEQLGNYKKAISYYFQYQAIKDTLLTSQIHNQVVELETKYQTEKKEKELKIKDAELLRKEAEIKQRNLQRNALVAGFFLLLMLAIAIYRSYRQKRKANIILSQQKSVIETKNAEITASIRYAKNIQNALLPHPDFIKEVLPESFIFYRPKDIVSGDFYWIGLDGPYAYVAVVDSTGHGVPGAFISLLGFNLMTGILKENPGVSPSIMLDLLNRRFSERLFKSYEEEALKDSMDLALCRIDFKNRSLEYAGAYNPLWVARKGEMIVKKADKLSIGSFLEYPDRQYTLHELTLEKDDMIYLFSDGFADQFGGPREKKFMYKPFKEILLKGSNKPPDTQRKILEQKYLTWKGDLEQVDDILVIGVKIM